MYVLRLVESLQNGLDALNRFETPREETLTEWKFGKILTFEAAGKFQHQNTMLVTCLQEIKKK